MPRNNVQADSCFQLATEYLLKNPNLTVQDAMKLADFSPSVWNDKAKYIMVICPWNKTKIDDSFTLPAQSIETMSRQNSEEPMSSVTMSAESNVTSPPALAKKAKITHETAAAAQLHWFDEQVNTRISAPYQACVLRLHIDSTATWIRHHVFGPHVSCDKN